MASKLQTIADRLHAQELAQELAQQGL
jgi:hypothetical protein